MLILAVYFLLLSSSNCDDTNKGSKLLWDIQNDGVENRKYITTTNRPYWKESTSTPPVFEIAYSSSLESSEIVLYVGIFFVVLILGCGFVYCLKYTFESGECSCTSDSPPPTPNVMTIPAPTRVVVPPPESARPSVFQNIRSHVSASPLFNMFGETTAHTSNAAGNSSGFNYVALHEIGANDVEVKPGTPDTPPPKYKG